MALIEENAASPSADGRRQARSSIFLAAIMCAGTERAPVKIRNMSPGGAMVESAVAPVAGSKVDLIRGMLVAQGTVVWSLANRCGVRFASEVSVKCWLAATTQVEQQRVDEIVALVKSGATERVLSNVTPRQARSHEQLVGDLGAVIQLMQDLENELASSDATLERHGMKLQNLDIAMQMVRAIAGELGPDDDMAPVSLAKLEDLRVACSKALGKAQGG